MMNEPEFEIRTPTDVFFAIVIGVLFVLLSIPLLFLIPPLLISGACIGIASIFRKLYR